MARLRTFTSFILSFLLLLLSFVPFVGNINAQPAPYLTLNSFSGYPGVTLQVFGGNYIPGDSLTILAGGKSIDTLTVNSDSTFGPINVNVPVNTLQGGFVIKGVGLDPADTASNNYYVNPFTPSITVSSSSLHPYDVVNVTGSGFAPNEKVAISIQNSTVIAGSDTNGSFTSTPLTVPNINQGSYTINAIGQLSNASAVSYVYIGGFYPNAYPSSYYILPGKVLSFSGGGFANSETISVYEGANITPITSFTADASGNFKNAGSFIIPFSYANSQRAFKLVGSLSNAQTQLSVGIGEYLPSVSPSAFFLLPGDILNFNGNNFFSNEAVNIFDIKNNLLGTLSSNTNGSFMNLGNIVIPFNYQGTTQTFNLVGSTSNASASASVNIGKYYPNVSASSYYILPGQVLTFSGNGFVPGETISVTQGKDSTVLNTITVDSKGGFMNKGNITIPYSYQNTQATYHLIGDKSQDNTDLSIGVGQLNPQLSPSSYYIKPAEKFNVIATGFAPNENVEISIGGNNLGSAITDQSGNTTIKSLTMPFSNSKSVTLSAQGQTSLSTAAATVTLGSYFPYVSSSNYYVLPGSTISFSGEGFAPNESVDVTSGLTNIETLQTDDYGKITSNTLTVPYGSLNSIAYAFKGELSNAAANITIGIAAFYPSVSSDNYYVRPGNTIHVSGSGFVPNEKVDITLATYTTVVSTDSLGNISKASILIPFDLTKSVDLTAKGELSLAQASTTITLAPFYPSVNPSTYYTKQGSTVTFTGNGFAPLEPVNILLGKSFITQIKADANGDIQTSSLTLPFGESNAQFTFNGTLSITSVSVNIGLQGLYPGLSLSSYYAKGGDPITINGSGYLPNENVSITFGSTNLGTVKADSMGSFTYPTTVPYSTYGKKTVTANGLTSMAGAQTTFTQAEIYVSLQLGSYAGKPGTAIDFIGSGYLPGESIQLNTDRTGSNAVYTFTADKSGNFNDSGFIIPVSFAEGNITLTLTGTQSLNPQSIVFYVVHP